MPNRDPRGVPPQILNAYRSARDAGPDSIGHDHTPGFKKPNPDPVPDEVVERMVTTAHLADVMRAAIGRVGFRGFKPKPADQSGPDKRVG